MSQAHFERTPKIKTTKEPQTYESLRSESTNVNNISKWKFTFKKGLLVEDSDIGPENSKMELYSIPNFLTKSILTFFSRNITFFSLILAILSIILDNNIFTNLPRFYTLLEFILIFLLQISMDLYFYFQNGRIENRWKDSRVKKIIYYDKKSFVKKIKISEVKIGDLLLIRNSEISPADLLVVASSTIRHGESIFHTNERRIDGQHIFYTKRAVKNLIGSTSSKHIKATEGVNKVTKLLSGHVEYDPPNDSIKFNGIFKLINDPKVIMFTSKNTLFAGTKLCSSWVIGIAIYNGRSTKIMQKYKNFLNRNQKISFKKTKGDEIFNNSILTIFFICLVEFLISIIMLIGNTSTYKSLQSINEIFGIGITKIFLGMIMNYTTPIPLAIFFYMDIITFYNAYIIQKKFNTEKVNVKNEELFLSRDAKKKNSSETILNNNRKKNEGAFTIELKKFNERKNVPKSKGILKPNKKKFEREESIMDSQHSPAKSKLDPSPESPHIMRRLNTIQTVKHSTNNFILGKDKGEKLVKITDFRVLSNMGDIEHVVFDKTDTLTKTTIEIKRIATVSKNYMITSQEISNLYKEVQKNPEKYNTRDEEEDQLKLEVISKYSEKSQE